LTGFNYGVDEQGSGMIGSSIHRAMLTWMVARRFDLAQPLSWAPL